MYVVRVSDWVLGCRRLKADKYEIVRKFAGGPWLDWALIQPLFLGANCDVAILLDCCFAGQAVRSRLQNHVEFLAATDKDQFTPTGQLANRPSFTKVLMQELGLVLREASQVTLSELHHRMLSKEAGLVKQPFYAVLSRGSSGAGIRIAKWEPIDRTMAESRTSIPASRGQAASLYLQLSLFHPLDVPKREALLRWLTRDSPSDIEHIQVIQQAISEAQAVERVNSEILYPMMTVSSEGTPLHVANDARDEAKRLTSALSDALTIPETYQFAELDVAQVIKIISEKSEQLLAFMTDYLATSSQKSLELLRTEDLYGVRDLASKIAMRLTLIQDETPQDTIRLYFDQIAPVDQHLWIGRRGEDKVLVEYWQYDTISNHDLTRNLKQAARISALLSEDKSKSFRILPGLGYMHEAMRRRIGFAYRISPNLSKTDYWTLSELISTVKSVPLEVRSRLASTLCDSVLHLHSIGWFHKAIKSWNIVVFRDLDYREREEQPYQHRNLENSYMIGFDCSRPSEAETCTTVDFSISSNIYRHPERWGKPKKFERHHDLYALVRQNCSTTTGRLRYH